jgi:DNA-binding NarL/FixJ family response regulator
MALESFPSTDTQFSEYQRLAAEYQDAVQRCESQLSHLAAIDRQLRALTPAMNGKITPYVRGKVDSVRSELAQSKLLSPALGPRDLSNRELEIFKLIGMGLTTNEVAEHLSLAVSTIETYRERIKLKLNLPSGIALVRSAVLWMASQDQHVERVELERA